MNKEKRSPFELMKTIFTAVIMIIAIGMMIFTIVSVNTFDKADRSLFGYSAFIVNSDSMSATDFNAGDLIFTKVVDPTTIVEGDIITYTSMDPASFGETITHKVRTITVDADGYPAFITYGTTTGTDDAYAVSYDQVIGKYQFTIANVGTFFNFLKTVPGYICCIFVPFMILIILEGMNSIRLFKQYKAEQMAEIEEERNKEMEKMAAEREKLEAERLESQKMLEELQKLQAQMAEQSEGKQQE